MEEDITVLSAVLAWIPYVIYLGVNIWLVLKLVAVLRTLVATLEGIRTKLEAYPKDPAH